MFLYWVLKSEVMKTNLEILKISIGNVLALTSKLTIVELNEIPSGYSNNLIWNVAHLLVTQKVLIYGLSGNDLGLKKEFIDKYKSQSLSLEELYVADKSEGEDDEI